MSTTAIHLILEEVPQPATDTSAHGDVLRDAVDAYEGVLLGYAQGMLGDLETARDVVQDCFLRLHRELRKGVPENVKAWLFRVCRNRAIDLLRKESRLSVVEADLLEQFQDESERNPAARAVARETHQRALELLERLPANQREVIRLKFQGDLSYKEISAVTNLSVGNVGYLLHHGLKNLRDLMHESE